MSPLVGTKLPRTCATARPQLAKADTAFQGASVGQPTKPCLAPQQNTSSSGARHWRPFRHVGLGGCPSLGGCETVATAGDSVIGPQVVQWPHREYLRPADARSCSSLATPMR